MRKKILWLDNDPGYINVYVKTLVGDPAAYEVVIVSTVTDAEERIAGGKYDLLILDVMVPTTNEREETLYPPKQTDHGLKTGLSFYLTHRNELNAKGTKVLVLTARIDATIKQEFTIAGLSSDSIFEKAEVAEVPDFLKMIQTALGGS